MQIFVVLAQVENTSHHFQVHLPVFIVAQNVEPHRGIDGTAHPTVPHHITFFNFDILQLCREKSLKDLPRVLVDGVVAAGPDDTVSGVGVDPKGNLIHRHLWL